MAIGLQTFTSKEIRGYKKKVSERTLSTLPDGWSLVEFLFLFSAVTAQLVVPAFNQSYNKERESLTEIPTDIDANGFENIYLNYNQISHFPREAFPNPNTWLMLFLNHNEISEIESQAFLGMLKLTDLELRHNKLTKLKAGMFDGLTALTNLQLGYNQIAEIDIGALNIAPLEDLVLRNNLLTLLTAEMLRDLPALKNLLVEENRLQTLESDVLSSRQSLYVSLSDPWITDVEKDNPWQCDERLCCWRSGNSRGELFIQESFASCPPTEDPASRDVRMALIGKRGIALGHSLALRVSWNKEKAEKIGSSVQNFEWSSQRRS